jgi:hypothetical protein
MNRVRTFLPSPHRAPRTVLRRGTPRSIVLALCVGGSCLLLLPAAATSAPVNRPYFSAAKTLWESEAEVVSGASQNVPLLAAVADLQLGLAQKSGDVQGYASAIDVMRNFESIPLTSESEAQMRKVRSDWSRLNTFFELTPAQALVLMDDSPSGAYYEAALRAFAKEPANNQSGVDESLLEVAARDLARESSVQPSRSILYSAAISDLLSLKGASAKDIAATSSSFLDPYFQDIFYLNVFFESSRLAGAPPSSP